MVRVQILVEGKTEGSFIKRILSSYLGHIHLQPILPGRIGGNIRYSRVEKDLVKAIKASSLSSTVYVSTAFDYQGIGADWPGLDLIKEKTEGGNMLKPTEIGDILRNETIKRIKEHLLLEKKDVEMSRFIPYFQIHEFEALLFSDIDLLVRGIDKNISADEIKKQIGDLIPEEINKDTPPSKIIKQLYEENDQKYRKLITALGVAAQITIPKMREKCPNFNRWIEELEKLKAT